MQYIYAPPADINANVAKMRMSVLRESRGAGGNRKRMFSRGPGGYHWNQPMLAVGSDWFILVGGCRPDQKPAQCNVRAL